MTNFSFLLDAFVNNVYQIYCYQERSTTVKKFNLLSFTRKTVNNYYHSYEKSAKSANSFSATRKPIKVNSDICYSNNSHWIGKGNPRRCSGRIHFSKYKFACITSINFVCLLVTYNLEGDNFLPE